MANTLKLGAGKWATGTDTVLAFNDENNNFKPLPFSFSRASSATVVNQSGLIETVGSGTPRIDFKDNTKGALLLEPQRTNLITYSEDFSNSGWNKNNTTVTSGFSAPDGTNNAYKLIENSSNSTHVTWLQAATTSATHCFSLFAKVGERKRIALRDNQIGNSAVFDLESGSVVSGSGGSIVYFGNGFYRITLKGNYASAATRHEIYILPDNATTATTSYQGDGSSGVYIFGAQLEAGSYPTSYIPTSGSAVTRVKDTCSQTTPSGVIGQTEGVVYIDFIAQNSTGQSQSHFWLGATGSEIGLYGGSQFVFYSSGGVQISSANIVTGQRYKIAFGYKANDYVAYINGTQAGTDTSATVPTMSGLSLGSYFNGNEVQKKNINDFKLYNTRLSNAELQALTTI